MEMILNKEEIEETLRKYYEGKGLLVSNIEVKQMQDKDIQANVVLKPKNIEILTKEDKEMTCNAVP